MLANDAPLLMCDLRCTVESSSFMTVCCDELTLRLLGRKSAVCTPIHEVNCFDDVNARTFDFGVLNRWLQPSLS